MLTREAHGFLDEDDSRLLLNTVVTAIEYSDNGVRVTTSDNAYITADYAVCTFSIGVLQHTALEFKPALPMRKQFAINAMEMGIYIKVFFQFPDPKVLNPPLVGWIQTPIQIRFCGGQK